MAEKEYISLDTAYNIDALEDWYISSVSQDNAPVWTEEHLEELLNDFYVIPKDTPTVDVVPVVRCKDCIFRESLDSDYGGCCCEMVRREVQLDDYCSFGKRENNDG